MDKQVETEINKIYKDTKPISVFIYGSRAREDFKNNSDYEIGVLFEKEKKWGRRELKQLHTLDHLNLYPFVYENFLEYSLDTPFPRAVYLRELLEGAKTVRGEKVVEKMEPPAVTLSDLLEVGTFQIAYALGAVLSSRQNDLVTASIEFTKSVLFGARVLVILETKKFPLEYDQITQQALKLDLEPQFIDLIKHAVDVRSGANINQQYLYTNITFLNQVVLQRVRDGLKKGNKVILKGRKI
jgi:predicted nucleotidyltransferase